MIKQGSLLYLFTCMLPVFAIARQTQSQGEGSQVLADKFSNPVTSMISVPFQNNTGWGIGKYNGSKNTLNFQPVIPFKLNSTLNLITRYIIPIIDQRDITGSGTHQFGLSDATISAFFSPANSKNCFIWGTGPVFLLPVTTNHYPGTKKLGPNSIALKQSNGNTLAFPQTSREYVSVKPKM